MLKTLPAFSPAEKSSAHALLAARVARMMGGKFEEDYWNEVYCRAKSIPRRGWSNLSIDVNYNGVGVEHKMLCYRSSKPLLQACGTTLMHPAATRSIRLISGGDPNEAMRDVFSQYKELIAQRKAAVQEMTPAKFPDLRTGWLLWQASLEEFLYFEEEMTAPDSADYVAEWSERKGGGARKSSTNLWIYELKTGLKRYSVTTEAGTKIQPYFTVPPSTDPNLYHFRVQGEQVDGGLVRIWLTPGTARELNRVVGGLDPVVVSNAIEKYSALFCDGDVGELSENAEACTVLISSKAYELLSTRLEGVNPGRTK